MKKKKLTKKELEEYYKKLEHYYLELERAKQEEIKKSIQRKIDYEKQKFLYWD